MHLHLPLISHSLPLSFSLSLLLSFLHATPWSAISDKSQSCLFLPQFHFCEHKMSSFSYSYYHRIRALNLCLPLSLKSSTAVTSFHYQHGMGCIGTPTELPSPRLQSHCVKHQNFPPAVIITDVLKRQSLSPTWTATDAESLKFCILTTLKL